MKQLSVIICTYNRVNYLLDALDSLINQDVDKSIFEIIIVDNNSQDNTNELCKTYINKVNNIEIKYVIEKKVGLSAARNKGIEICNSEFVVFIDDDAIAEKDFVRNLIDYFLKYPNFVAIGGKVLPIYPNNNEPLWMSSYLQRLVSKVDDGDEVREFKNKYPVGCNMAFRKNIFAVIGGFNETLTARNDDKYIFNKIKKARLKTLYAPTVIVHHNIEEYRLDYNFIKNLSRINGATDRIRLNDSHIILVVFKFFDYIIKLIAAVFIALGYIINLKFQKAQYIVMVMANTLYGFMRCNKNL